MKKIIAFGLSCIAILSLVACNKKDPINPIDPSLPTEISSKFTGKWNRPGLYNEDGSAHVMPEVLKPTGMTIDVTDYGAKKNDASFDNYGSFKKALESASAGDTVKVPDGKYYFKGYAKASTEYYAQIIVPSGVILEGESRGNTIIVSCYNEAINRDESTTVIAAVNVKNVLIKNLTVTSNTDDSMLPDKDNQNLQTTVYTAPKYGITLASGGNISEAEEQARNLVVDNVLVEKFQRMGVRISKAQECIVQNSVFQKATCLGGGGMGYGVNIQGYGNGIDTTDSYIDTRFNVVRNSEFVGPYLRHGALVQYYAHNNLISNNKFNDSLLDAIDMHGEDEYSNEIEFNQIINTRKGAAVGLGNTGATHDAAGRNNYIHDNTIEGGERGIDIILGTPDSIVYNNKITNVNKGITCTNANGTVIIGNEIASAKRYGLEISYSYVYSNPAAGIPNNYVIRNNKFTSCATGININSKGSNFICRDNEFTSMDNDKQIIDTSASFKLPEESNLTTPIAGEIGLPTDNNFITREDENLVGTQKNMKFKTSNLEPKFNRLIYAKFDKSMLPKTYEKVYLSITAKSQAGTPTINIFVNTTWTNWTEDTITWNNSLLHHETLGVVKETAEHKVSEFVNFTFPAASYEFTTYYIDVTDSYKALADGLFTMILTNENIDESYMEIYSKNQTANDYAQAFRFIFA